MTKVNTADSINNKSFVQKTFTEANSNPEQGFSSESADSEDSCCEGGNGNDELDNEKGGDDLTPSELEDLQNDIIKALENFDMLYNNKKKPQAAKSLDRTTVTAGKKVNESNN